MSNFYHSSDDQFQGADLCLFDFAKVVHHSDDVMFFEGINDGILLTGDDLLVVDSVEADKGAVDEAFAVRYS